MLVLAFLVSMGVTQDTISVGPSRGPYPVFKNIHIDLFKNDSFTYSFIHVFNTW